MSTVERKIQWRIAINPHTFQPIKELMVNGMPGNFSFMIEEIRDGFNIDPNEIALDLLDEGAPDDHIGNVLYGLNFFHEDK